MDASLVPLEKLTERARWVWEQTLLIHKRAPETRVASSLSPVEALVCLYYGGILRYSPEEPLWEGRDRLIVSKGHGSIALYPILADLGFFPVAELQNVCRPGSFLGGIPDPVIPGYETVNGSLGHGLGVGCGMAVALQRRHSDNRVWVMVGDGELHEGAVWEAIMFAGHHRLGNLSLIVDNNSRCMLNDTNRVLRLAPLAEKLKAFGWRVEECDGHDLAALYPRLSAVGREPAGQPYALIANTIKGHGVPSLEASPMSHVLSVSAAEIDRILAGVHAADH
jgi:transketolase